MNFVSVGKRLVILNLFSIIIIVGGSCVRVTKDGMDKIIEFFCTKGNSNAVGVEIGERQKWLGGVAQNEVSLSEVGAPADVWERFE